MRERHDNSTKHYDHEDYKSDNEPATKVVYLPEQRKKLSGVTILLMIAVFVMLIFVISGYSTISANNLDNLQLQENIDNVKAEIELIEMQIGTSDDISEIERRAGELGMDFPNANDVVELPVSEGGDAQTESDEDESSGIFDLIADVRGWFS